MSLWLLPVITLAAVPQGPSVRLLVESGVRCELNTTLARALTEQQLQVVFAGDPAAWVLSVARDGEAVSVRVTDSQGALRGARRLSPTAADCPTLSRTVALLVKSWVALQLRAQDSAVASVPTGAGGAGASSAAGASANGTSANGTSANGTSANGTSANGTTSATGVSVTGVSVTRDSARGALTREAPATASSTSGSAIDQDKPGSPAADRGELTPPPALAAPELVAPAAAEFFVERPAPLPRPATGGSASVTLTGGGAIAVSDLPVATGRLGLEWGFLEPWGAGVDAGLQTERAQRHVEGAIAVSLRWASFWLRRSFFADGARGLFVSVGFQVIHLLAVAHGFQVSSAKNLFGPGATASVEWRQPITSGLFVLIRVSGQVRQAQQFSIGGLGPLLNIPGWGAGLEGGVGWKFL